MPRPQLRLNASSPSIIVPVTARDRDGLDAQIAALHEAAAQFRDSDGTGGRLFDLVEWRVDLYEPFLRRVATEPGAAAAGPDSAVAGLIHLADLLPDVPVLATFRPRAEGGDATLSDDAYVDLIEALAASGRAAAVDVEFRHPRAARAIEAAHAHGTSVVASNHDFDATPAADEIVERLAEMEDMGAEVAKIAVMPRTAADVVTLIEATERRSRAAGIPLVTMAMGALGAVTRVAGAVFGSAATFATVGHTSAPGQLPAADVRGAMRLLDPAGGPSGPAGGPSQP